MWHLFHGSFQANCIPTKKEIQYLYGSFRFKYCRYYSNLKIINVIQSEKQRYYNSKIKIHVLLNKIIIVYSLKTCTLFKIVRKFDIYLRYSERYWI